LPVPVEEIKGPNSLDSALYLDRQRKEAETVKLPLSVGRE
jgi:hypothetical protein